MVRRLMDGKNKGGAAARRFERRNSLQGKQKPVAKADQSKKGGSAKQRARGLERLLKKATLPDDIRRAKESELAALRTEGQKAKRVQREKAFSKMYHKVKFFERQKVERRIGQLQKQLAAAAPAAKAALEAQLVEAEHDLLYVRHFPRNKKYLSLFPAEPLEEGGFVAKLQAQIRARIIRRSEAGLLNEQPGHVDDEDEEDSDAGELEAELEADDFFAADAEEAEEAEEEAEEEEAEEVRSQVQAPAGGGAKPGRKDRGNKKRKSREREDPKQKKQKKSK